MKYWTKVKSFVVRYKWWILSAIGLLCTLAALITFAVRPKINPCALFVKTVTASASTVSAVKDEYIALDLSKCSDETKGYFAGKDIPGSEYSFLSVCDSSGNEQYFKDHADLLNHMSSAGYEFVSAGEAGKYKTRYTFKRR